MEGPSRVRARRRRPPPPTQRPSLHPDAGNPHGFRGPTAGTLSCHKHKLRMPRPAPARLDFGTARPNEGLLHPCLASHVTRYASAQGALGLRQIALHAHGGAHTIHHHHLHPIARPPHRPLHSASVSSAPPMLTASGPGPIGLPCRSGARPRLWPRTRAGARRLGPPDDSWPPGGSRVTSQTQPAALSPAHKRY